jgi:hypothetical protein
VTATDSVYHTVISGAAVTWFTDTYSWDSVNKKWTVPPVESSLAGTPVNTGSNGVALLPDDQMTDSTQAPVTGQELPNSTYTCYGFQVSASDYNTQTFDSQFWVKKGQQMEVDSGVQNDTKMIRTVNVSLVPLP